MTRVKCWLVAMMIPMLAGILLATTVSAQHEYIDIRNPSLRKIPIAIPIFRVAGDPGNLSTRTSDMVAEDLDFTGYFKILNRGAYLMDPNNPVTDAASIQFKDWMTIGAELLVTGNIVVNNDLIEMELRLFDPFKGQPLIGKRYKGWTRDMKRMVRKFCSEIIYYLTGNWGIFESRIAYISTETGKKEVFICDFDGSNPKRMTRFNSIALTPAWSSDGQWLAFTAYPRKRPDLFVRSVTSDQGYVFSKDGLNSSPAWIPGKFEIAATLSFSGDQDIYLLTGKGKIIKQLTDRYGIDTSPTISPDGQQMAFVSSRSGGPQIYIQGMQGGQVRRLTFEGQYNTQPNWSPRGDKIAYSSAERGEINIWIMDLASGRAIRLTYGSGKNESPTWSPDGSLIAFSSNREGRWRIYVMTVFGTEQRRLINVPGDQTSPSWSPRIVEE